MNEMGITNLRSIFAKLRSRAHSFLAPLWLFFISSVTHLLYFGYPAAVVFDETYAGRFLNSYWQGSFFFDVHPPLGKLVIFLFSQFIGSDPSAVSFETINDPLPYSMLLLRLVPIICGILLPLVVYFICRNLNLSRLSSFFVGFLISIENSLVVQSRFILQDSLLVLSGFIAVLMYQLYRRNCESPETTNKHSKTWRYIFLFLSAVFVSVSFSIKWTGIFFLVFIIILELIRVLFSPDEIVNIKKRSTISGYSIKKAIRFILIYLVIGAVIYIATFAVSFYNLPRTGPGDAYVSSEFRKTLQGSPESKTEIQSKGFVGKFFELNMEMYRMNNTLTKPHQYSSEWYTWPFMTRSIFYWQEHGGYDSLGKNSYIYLLGNPLIYWLGTFSIVLLVLSIVFYREIFTDPKKRFAAFFILGGFLINLLPFIFIGRIMFLYHYEVALVFSIISMGFVIEMISRSKLRMILISIILLVCLLMSIFFSPLTYGLPLSKSGLADRIWLSTWR